MKFDPTQPTYHFIADILEAMAGNDADSLEFVFLSTEHRFLFEIKLKVAEIGQLVEEKLTTNINVPQMRDWND